ncbi:MAG: hypothetical protein KatS3mg059_0342 [Thermomicrobiales bacterium]|nr:MAG: hypothetical protein KatS3mg059_0342 [Thermomicrobiales bacterium]
MHRVPIGYWLSVLVALTPGPSPNFGRGEVSPHPDPEGAPPMLGEGRKALTPGPSPNLGRGELWRVASRAYPNRAGLKRGASLNAPMAGRVALSRGAEDPRSRR